MSWVEQGKIYRLAWVLYLLLAVAGAVWVGWREGAIPAGLFFDLDGWWEDLALGVGAGVLLLVVWDAARRSLESARELERRVAELLGRLEPSEALALAMISGFAEELFFRGAMQGSWGWLVTTAVFTLLHTGPGPAYRIWTLFALLAGLVLAGLAEWRGNLLAPVAAHVLVNGYNLLRLSTGTFGNGDRDR